MDTGQKQQEQLAAAFDAGRRVGFGVSALVLSLVAFLSLLGAEKAILAIVLGALAIRRGRRGTLSRRLGVAAISISSVFVGSLIVLLVMFWDQVVEFISILDKLS
jgi:MFS family permease